jgi:enoyl-CoA hydratase
MSDAVLVEQRDRVLLITLNRPDQMNSINSALANGLWDAVQRLDGESGLTAGVLTGNGRGFCSGMDLKGFLAGEDISKFFQFVKDGTRKPLIAAIEGLALTCDLLVAAKGAKLGIPEAGVGLFAGAGGLMRLPSRVGYGRAMEMAITADPISADDAFQYGLVARLAEPGEAVATALVLAERVARNAPLSVAASKQLVRASLGITEEEFWELQKGPFATVFGSNDAKEGPKAFAEKRAPNWTGT